MTTHTHRGQTILPTSSSTAKGRWYVARRTPDGVLYSEDTTQQYATLAQAREAIDMASGVSAAAAAMGRVRSPAKTAAAQANGKLGGRPRYEHHCSECGRLAEQGIDEQGGEGALHCPDHPRAVVATMRVARKK